MSFDPSLREDAQAIEEELEKAAIRIQALTRGRSARKQLEAKGAPVDEDEPHDVPVGALLRIEMLNDFSGWHVRLACALQTEKTAKRACRKYVHVNIPRAA